MPIIRAQCVFPYGSNLPEDVITNTFHFDIPTADPDPFFDAIADNLSDLYTTCHNPAGGWANYVNWGAAEVRFYLLAAPPPRVPAIRPLVVGASGSASSVTPAEVSVCLSFQGEPLSGVPQARRRGRVYLGGFALPCATSSSVSPPRVLTTLITQVQGAAETFMNACETALTPWQVWSTTDGSAVEVTNGWVDNEPDIQRRRGVQPTLRSLFP